MKKKWVTLFANCENFHLIKDVGYIPYVMSERFNYDSYIVTFNNGSYDYVNTYLKGLKISFLDEKIKNEKLAILKYLFKCSKKTDVLQVFHISITNLIYIFVYKSLNRKGKTYLKLDASEAIKNIKVGSGSVKGRIYELLLKRCDLISVETTVLAKWLNQNWPVDVEYIPNGFWNSENKKCNSKKYNYITTVGRLGAKYKETHILIEAFQKIHINIPEWKLRLVGPMTREFEDYLKDILDKNEDLKRKIIIDGYISDLEELDSIYEQSKIFCLTSSLESFGLVFVEALKNGCYILTSNVLAAKDVTNNESYGRIFDAGKSDELASLLNDTCNHYDEVVNIDEIKNFAHSKFDWYTIGQEIYSKINKEY